MLVIYLKNEATLFFFLKPVPMEVSGGLAAWPLP